METITHYLSYLGFQVMFYILRAEKFDVVNFLCKMNIQFWGNDIINSLISMFISMTCKMLVKIPIFKNIYNFIILCSNFITFLPFCSYNFSSVEWNHLNPKKPGGGGGPFRPPSTFRAITLQRAKLSPWHFMTFFFRVSRIFWHQICDARGYGSEVM